MKVYGPNNLELCKLNEYEFKGDFMGESMITSTKNNPTPIDFKIGSYVEYRGDKFHIYFPKPSDNKTAHGGAAGDAFSYELTFYSRQKKLTEIGFYDYVPGYDDTDLYFTGSPEVTFYGTVYELAGRIQANLDRFYSDIGQNNPWSVNINTSFADKVERGEIILDEKTIGLSNVSCWEALQAAYDQFNVKFNVEGDSIEIGYEGTILGMSLEYGKDKGLRSIQRTYDDTEKFVTRLKVVGGSENLPADYRKSEKGVASNVRLPESWGKEYIDIDYDYNEADPDTYVWRALKEEYGIIEGSKAPYDIKPSIEDALDGTGNPLDEITVGTNSDISDEQAEFDITVRFPGFNPVELTALGDSPRISIKSQRRDGHAARLGGYEFNILSTDISSDNMVIKLARNTEETTALPSQALTLDQGDKFVYLGIEMPEQYVLLAENRVLEKGKQDVRDNNGLSIQYNMEPSAIYLAKNPSVANLLAVGNLVPMVDADLGLEGQPIRIQSLTIQHGREDIPIYSLTVANIKFKSLRDSIRIAGQNQSNYNSLVKNTLNSNTNITNIIGGSTPTWQIYD